ncbi:beta--glucan-binding [Stylonychia lemnae]|uniref:Beta--glucan-binding n=1 Tax=Stylonychia lemnae TaxID=5949 RepID=A0A077ZZT2_STYLE|nr:beta--glucan-binding [Stylonychia lemnae]|eukprot:CDW75132.1 beta--glucan-binding [Stylonychia lemnae]
MKRNLLILSVVSVAAATETLIFNDDFNKLDLKTWQHELTLSGGGNWEFEWYVNNRSNSFTKDGVLYLKPTMTEDYIGTQQLQTGDLNIWGSSPADACTANAFYGCERNAAASGNVNNPIRSARLRTVNSFSFQYGRVEIKAQLPKGDWLWPAIWMLPKNNEFGNWPASGEIDIMESRGNDPNYQSGGHDTFASTLHWGPNWDQNRYPLTHKDYKHSTTLTSDFHTYGLYWDENGLYTYFDDPSHKVLEVDFKTQSFWQRGTFPSTFDNPWVGEPNAAPFNREFYLVLNLAVGGTSGYFPEGMGGKPWSDQSQRSVNEFWNARGAWQQTWKGDDSALKIDSIKVWKFDSAKNEEEVTFL